MTRRLAWGFATSLLLALGTTSPAQAANILFVADGTNDANIPTVLSADGHSVTIVTGDYVGGDNPTLRGDLSAYHAVFWSASGTGSGNTHTNATVFTNLTDFATRGGYVFVTGYDSVASPVDPQLLAFVGGTGTTDVPGPVGAVVASDNALTTGVVDIRGVTPTGGYGDRDTVTGLGADTVAVCSTASGSGVGQAQWTLRTISRGRIAYVSNGACQGCAPDPTASWADTTAGGAGAYNAALRNFARNSGIARVLFVSDTTTDGNIPSVLTGDGHMVTTVTGDFAAGDNPTLRGSLAAYDAVVWSATGGGSGSTHTNTTVFTNLTAFVNAGGFVFVTGYDSIASPGDPQLISFLGGTGSTDVPGPVGAVTSASNELTVGLVDIRGVTPTGGYGDRDTMTGLGGDTVAVASTASGSGAGNAQWTLRSLMSGRIAYVSNGACSGCGPDHPSWADTTAGGAGAYNAALRNFLFAARGTGAVLGTNGSVCTAPSDCLSGNCVDGVCCDNTCGGGATDDCQACSAAAGAAVDGTCGALTATAAPTVVCRASADACDAAETCVGGDTICPADVLAGAGTECRAASGLCDVAETCSGSSPACPADSLSSAGTVCRASAGTCDAAETCNGVTAACPGDVRAAAGAVCRTAIGACDVTEVCDGASATCPSNSLAPAGTMCRATAGMCDAAEACDGATPTCPADSLVAAGTMCRAAAGDCDVAEACDGASVSCPADALAAAGTECRAAGDACDPAEVCDGAAGACPADSTLPDGSDCGDGTTCNGDEVCAAGVCTLGTTLECDDGDVCTADSCAEPGGCANDPIDGCCMADVDCDDGDACTTDTCDTTTNACSSEPIEGCGGTDAGMVDEDAGTTADGGVNETDASVPGTDAGSGGGRTGGGCGCSAPGRSDPTPLGVLLGLGAALFVARRRRRR